MTEDEAWAHYRAHVVELSELARLGDETAIKSLSCMAWLIERLGKPVPPGPNGGDVVDMSEWLRRRAA